jgi:replicative DNA helicase
MSSLQLVTRLISSESEIASDKLRSGNLAFHEMEQIHTKIRGLSEAPIFIDDTPALSIFELRAKARRLKAQHDIQLIVIDYLQLMTIGGDNRGNREQEISTISRSLKSIAKELEIPIMALSQLSRSVETRGGDKKPQLSDLRESGAIEQDADMVIFLHRPEYYNLTEDAEGNSTLGIANVIISKHRNGQVGDIQVKFVQNLAKFGNLDRGDYSDFGMDSFGKLPDNKNFDSGTITYSSRMNDDDGDDDQDDPPF